MMAEDEFQSSQAGSQYHASLYAEEAKPDFAGY